MAFSNASRVKISFGRSPRFNTSITSSPQRIPTVALRGSTAGTAAELAVGFGLAQQMMRDGFAGGTATPTSGHVLPELMSAAEAAQALGVSEADVMAVLESGELKGKKIGATWRVPRAALTAYMAQ